MEKIYVAFINDSDREDGDDGFVGVFSSLEKAKEALTEINPEVTNFEWETSKSGTIHYACVYYIDEGRNVSYNIYESKLDERISENYTASELFQTVLNYFR